MFGPIPEIVAGAGAMAVFAFALLGMVWQILKGQQALITNHQTELVRALLALKDSIDRKL